MRASAADMPPFCGRRSEAGGGESELARGGAPNFSPVVSFCPNLLTCQRGEVCRQVAKQSKAKLLQIPNNPSSNNWKVTQCAIRQA